MCRWSSSTIDETVDWALKVTVTNEYFIRVPSDNGIDAALECVSQDVGDFLDGQPVNSSYEVSLPDKYDWEFAFFGSPPDWLYVKGPMVAPCTECGANPFRTPDRFNMYHRTGCLLDPRQK